ncbi:MAG: hypothetical protein GY707_18010, partial [Desulfobacteraceae bacterium]|nr:hypothetical protein [Desulfobacteraceae bacterium]
MQKKSSRKKNFSLVPFFVILFLFLLGIGIFYYTNVYWLSPSEEKPTEPQVSLNKNISVPNVLKTKNNSYVSDTSATNSQQPTPEFSTPHSNDEDVLKTTTSPSMLLEVEKELQQMFTVEKS